MLTGQRFDALRSSVEKLEQWKQALSSYVRIENGIAVLSDFLEDSCYIFSGKFGEMLGLAAPSSFKVDSAFEDELFRCILPDDLLERHVAELRFFQFQKTIPIAERPYYSLVNLLHFRLPGEKDIPVLHRTCYVESLPNGSVWLGACLYTPFVENGLRAAGQIVDNRTGQAVLPDVYAHFDKQLLSKREADVLHLLSKGFSSKEIASRLCLSVNTVYRHRQNILSALQVNNTAAAVEVGLRLHLIALQD